MDDWIARERNGRISWKDQTLDSISAPPLSLLLFFLLVITLLYLNTLSEVAERIETKRAGLRLRLLLLPLAVALLLVLNTLRRRVLQYDVAGRPLSQIAEDCTAASGVLLFLLLLLLLVYYKPSFQFAWFRIF
ncbi:uncharacterized protein LOC127265199 [Andrographis paniculata]|uniref:uncharacterized protein LOC127265199 n=1 Tax=Andrographis paniculata TaxID=175694 RepID=UPI0021E7D1A3|nr:uncharacterized protein LOC127265199 [Andrographis paniculata]